MGILNVTPDSFSDGGAYMSTELAVARGLEMAEQGADILDIGGESTRPGSDPVPVAEELSRVIPVIRALSVQCKAKLSVDTTKSEVARMAIEAGACIINDVSACTSDPAMPGVVRDSGAAVVLMHMKGTPKSMQDAPHYGNVVGEVGSYLSRRLHDMAELGVPLERMVIDPGIGFGKDLQHNLALMRNLPDLADMCRRPLLVGVSRKRWIGAIVEKQVQDRLAGSLAAMAFAIQRGARIIRVHDVKESCDTARMIDRLMSTEDERCR